jgi:large repetitive protein
MNRGKRTTRQALSSPRWALERLEERTLLSGNVTTVIHGGNLMVIGGAKGNEILIQSTSGGALQVSSLDGTTTINGSTSPFTSTAVTGNVDVLMGLGSDVVDVGGPGTITNLPHNLFVATLGGGDTVAVANATIGGGITLVGGAGSETFSIGSSSTEALVTVGGSVFIVGGTGDNNIIAVFNANISGNLGIISYGADDQVQVGFDAGLGIIGEQEPPHVTVDGNVDIATTGSDPGPSFSLPGDFGFDFGCVSVSFDSWSTGGGWAGGGGGINTALLGQLGWGSFETADLGKCLTNDLAFLSGSWCGGEWGLGGCGGGQNTDPSGGQDVSLVDVTVNGNVDVHTGNGNNQILLGAAPVPSGDTSAPLNLVFGPVTIGGNLHVSAGNGNNTVLLDGIIVTGNSNVTTGSGSDDIAVLGNAGYFNGTFSINSGSGNDEIAIINGATFLSSATIHAGAGADVLWVAQSLFTGSATFDGGAGTNTLLESQSLYPNSFTAGNPVVTNFPVQMLDVSPADPIVTTNFGWLNTLLGV